MDKESVEEATGDLGPGLEVAAITCASIPLVRLAHLDSGEQLARLCHMLQSRCFPYCARKYLRTKSGSFYFPTLL